MNFFRHDLFWIDCWNWIDFYPIYFIFDCYWHLNRCTWSIWEGNFYRSFILTWLGCINDTFWCNIVHFRAFRQLFQISYIICQINRSSIVDFFFFYFWFIKFSITSIVHYLHWNFYCVFCSIWVRNFYRSFILTWLSRINDTFWCNIVHFCAFWQLFQISYIIRQINRSSIVDFFFFYFWFIKFSITSIVHYLHWNFYCVFCSIWVRNFYRSFILTWLSRINDTFWCNIVHFCAFWQLFQISYIIRQINRSSIVDFFFFYFWSIFFSIISIVHYFHWNFHCIFCSIWIRNFYRSFILTWLGCINDTFWCNIVHFRAFRQLFQISYIICQINRSSIVDFFFFYFWFIKFSITRKFLII